PIAVSSIPLRPHPCSTPFPYTTLFRSTDILGRYPAQPRKRLHVTLQERLQLFMQACPHKRHAAVVQTQAEQMHHRGDAGQHHLRDRKSTRLNSSHVKISYAVFCLKK